MQSLALLTLCSMATASPILTIRQSSEMVDSCIPGSSAPTDFKAFDVGNCQAQLSYTADKNHIGIQATFVAEYADGSRIEHEPFQDYGILAVSDTFYRQEQGLNWLSSSSQSRQYTSVHEFSSICKNRAAPVFWRLVATPSGDVCQPQGYSFTSPDIPVEQGTRPSNPTASGRRIDAESNFEITWPAVDDAAAYTVILKLPSGEDEVGNPYSTTAGSRVSGSTTSLTLSGARSNGWEGMDRQVAVNVVNSQGVWNFTPENANVVITW